MKLSRHHCGFSPLSLKKKRFFFPVLLYILTRLDTYHLNERDQRIYISSVSLLLLESQNTQPYLTSGALSNNSEYFISQQKPEVARTTVWYKEFVLEMACCSCLVNVSAYAYIILQFLLKKVFSILYYNVIRSSKIRKKTAIFFSLKRELVHCCRIFKVFCGRKKHHAFITSLCHRSNSCIAYISTSCGCSDLQDNHKILWYSVFKK